MSSFYSGSQALSLALFFSGLDIAVNMFGLAWNGQYFTTDNIKHWFDLAHYKFTTNPIDFLGVAILRDCVLIGGGLAAWTSPSGFSEIAKKASNIVFAAMLVLLAFAPSKLLAFYEDDNLKLAVGDWILMIWCIFASLAIQARSLTFPSAD
ncbi:unnamed protein product [Heligmosomoides polygyrus]|uniref:Transmembrane protein 147 n=1 Tax=Heligmosomoides polygyrus TaxID=6339 RepID=A0A183GAT2_HELPZ|nr:unnamed protein product [Heligmosomoides polygyrus]